MCHLHFWPQKQRFDSHNVTPCTFWKKIRVDKRHDLYQIGRKFPSCKSVLKTCTEKFSNLFLEHFGKTLWTSPFSPSNRLFQKSLGTFFVRFLEPSDSCALIYPILNSLSSSQKDELETCKLHFLSLNIYPPFLAAETAIYPWKLFDMVPILSLTRVGIKYHCVVSLRMFAPTWWLHNLLHYKL